MNIVSMIINRDCHAKSSNLKVIRHVISRLKDGYSTFKAMPRKDRRTLMRACIKAQDDNRKEYNWVVLGHD